MNDSPLSDADAPAPAKTGTGGIVVPSAFRPLRPEGRLAVPIMATGRREDDILVKPEGTIVRRGEPLCEQWPDLSAAPLAPANGRIIGLGTAMLTARLTTPAVLFEADAGEPAVEIAPAHHPAAIAEMLGRLRQIDLAAGIEQLIRRGVWADRWTSPNLLGQLDSCLRKPVDTVVCDVLDQSPDLLLHCEIARAFPVELAAGVLAMAALTGAAQVWAVWAAYGDPDVWEILRRTALGTSLKIVAIEDHYPQSHPSLLIHELTGRHTRPARLPSEAGVLAFDAAAAVAIGRCFLDDEPMLSVPVGIHERHNDAVHWLSVPIGMHWSQVLAQGAITTSRTQLRAGNPLREMRLTHDCIIGGAEISVTIAPAERIVNPDPCIRCAWCVEGCPVSIQPAGLLDAAQQDDPYLADQYGLDACIECGICTYVCPSHLPILGGIRAMRASIARETARRG